MNKPHSLGFLLNKTSFALSKIIGASFETHQINLSYSQFILLRQMIEDSDMYQIDLENIFSKDSDVMNRIFVELEDKGFVEKNKSSEVGFDITYKGRETALCAIRCADEIVDLCLDSIDEQDAELFSDFFNKIIENASKLQVEQIALLTRK